MDDPKQKKPKLYVAYSSWDLADHGRRACKLATDCGWEVDDSANIQTAVRLKMEHDYDALLLISAFYYSESDVSIEEREWDSARKNNKAAAALIVDERSPWYPSKIQRGDTKTRALEAFHKKIKDTELLGSFGLAPETIDGNLTSLLSKLKDAAARENKVKVFVVWDFTVSGLDFILAAFKKNPPEGFLIEIPGLSGGGAAGEIFRDIVLPGIKNNHRVLIVTDQPNANVGYEAGLALGFGKPVSLVFFSSAIPGWVKDSAFKGFIVNQVQSVGQLRDVVRNEDNWYRPPSVKSLPSYGRTLFLSPSCYVGSVLREEMKALFPHWKVVQDGRFNIKDLETKFGDVAQVVWCITSFANGLDIRDGSENAGNSMLYGWFHARALACDFHNEEIGKKFIVLRRDSAREVVDVGVVENTFRNADDFLTAIKEIGEVDYRLPQPVNLGIKKFAGRDNVLSDAPYGMVELPLNMLGSGAGMLWVGQTQVTNRQYRLFCEATNSKWPEDLDISDLKEDHPVVQISLEEAERFCEWAGLELPDETLWIRIANPAPYDKYWWGDDDSLLEEVAWMERNSGGVIHAVSGKRPNNWGLYDVYGNVWEWTKRYEKFVDNPGSGEQQKVWRTKAMGGAYDSAVTDLSLSEDRLVTAKYRNVGFRCVRRP